MAEKQERVCVTGAGGFLASWVVKYLLAKGYMVHGTVRDPNDEKNAHLNKLDKATENLQLFKAELLDYNSLCTAIAGCTGVFHIASPCFLHSVPNPEAELIEPALMGTCNVLRACTEVKVKRVVIVSSAAAVMVNPKWPKGQAMDESSWSDKEFCRTTENWYCLSKTVAELEAWEYAKRTGLDVVTICPSIIIGPMLQSAMNSSSSYLVEVLKDGCEEIKNNNGRVVDVRDVTEAVLMAYEKPEAEGRYACMAHVIKMQDLINKLKSMYPNYNYPKKITEGDDNYTLNCEKLQKLGWNYRPLEESLADSVKSYQEKGILD